MLPAIAAMIASPGTSWAMMNTRTVTSARITSACSRRAPIYLAITAKSPADRSVLRLAVLEPQRMRPEPGFLEFQETVLVPALHALAIGGRVLFPPEPGILVGVIEQLLELPVDLLALLMVELLAPGFDQRDRRSVIAAPIVEAAP